MQLLQENANINAYSNQFKTPLHFAAQENHEAVVLELIKVNANLEAKDELKCTALHLACKKGSQECIELLLKKNADYYSQDNRKWTPLHYAAYNGHPRAVNFLLKWEADFDRLVNMRNTQDKTAFIISKNDKVKKAFERKYLFYIKFNQKYNFVDIWKACKDGNLDMVRMMIREGQDKEQQTYNEGNTPIHIAARNGHYLIVKYLIELGAQTNIVNGSSLTPKEYLQQILQNENQIEMQVKKAKTQVAKDKIREKNRLMMETWKLLDAQEKIAGGRA